MLWQDLTTCDEQVKDIVASCKGTVVPRIMIFAPASLFIKTYLVKDITIAEYYLLIEVFQ